MSLNAWDLHISREHSTECLPMRILQEIGRKYCSLPLPATSRPGAFSQAKVLNGPTSINTRVAVSLRYFAAMWIPIEYHCTSLWHCYLPMSSPGRLFGVWLIPSTIIQNLEFNILPFMKSRNEQFRERPFGEKLGANFQSWLCRCHWWHAHLDSQTYR
jgi:hypothetical protein